jgi:two-component system NtrC family sensor kinase
MIMGQKILIVEDDLVFRNYLFQVLKYDYEVVAVPGPLEAIEEIRKDIYSLMITDLRMPDMDGRALVEKVHRELDPNIMVIVITAFEDDWPVDIAMSSNVFRYLRKGAFMPSELKQNVEKALEVQGSIVSLEEYKRRADISETLYKDVFDNSVDALFVTDIALKPMAANRHFEEMCGYRLDELKDKTLFEIIAEEDRQQARQAFDSQMHGQGPGSIKVHFQTKDGGRRLVKVWVRLIKNVRGMDNSVFCIARDVDHQQEARKDAAASKELLTRLEEKTRELDVLRKKFNRLTAYSKDMIVWLDGACRCEYVNAEVEKCLGYSSSLLTGKEFPWKEIIHPDDRGVIDKVRELKKARVTSCAGEARIYAKSGSMLHLSYLISMEYGQNGSNTGLTVVAEDITQQKVAEQELKSANQKIHEFNQRLSNGFSQKIKALRESEERYKNIVEESADIIFSLDSEARIVYMNRAGLQAIGMTMEQIHGVHCSTFIVDEPSRKDLNRIIDSVGKDNYHEPFELVIETASGSRTFRATLTVISEKEHRETVCVAKDISDEIAKEKRLQLLANIEHYSADAIIGLDPQGVIISWNEGASAIFGWNEEDAVGKSRLFMVPEEGIREAEGMLQEVLARGQVKDYETRLKTKSGQVLDISITMTSLKDETGEVFGFSSIIKDLTEKKKMEAALIQSERLAAMGKLSASIAHEINNPLYGIRSCLNHVLNAEKGGVDHQFVRLAIKETDRIADLIRNMKTFYLPNEGKAREVDIHETLREVFILNRKYLEENMVKMVFNPEGARSIECVPEQIKQVFINIITNAVEAMPDGGELRVETRESEDRKSVSIVFRDTGIGISKDDLPQIFDMFYSKKPMVKGVGLGLSVSYGIVKRHGGSMDIQSEEGKGTTVTVSLPVNTAYGRQLQLDLK